MSRRGTACSTDKLQMNHNIQSPLALVFDKDGYLYASTKQGTVFKVKVESALDCGLLYGMAILDDELYTASHNDDGGIFTVNLEDRTFERIIGNRTECSKVHSLTVYGDKILFSDVGNHSLNVWNPATRECRTFSGNGKGVRDGKCAQNVQPRGVLTERKTVFVVDSSTGCLRMTSEVLPLVKYLSNLQTFAVTFGLHQKKQMPTSFTIDTAIARIQEVYEFDCQCIDQVKAVLGTEAQTQGPRGTVSSVVVEDERRILLAVGEIRDLFRKYTLQLLDVFKLKSLLTLVVENFFSKMRAGASDMPMHLQFDFRFSRAMKEHLKQMYTTRFSYYTSATSHCLRVKSDNPGTLPITHYAQVQPTITPLDFSKITEDGQDGARTTAHHDNSHELVYTTGDVVFLASA